MPDHATGSLTSRLLHHNCGRAFKSGETHFAWMAQNARSAMVYCFLPPERIVEFDVQIGVLTCRREPCGRSCRMQGSVRAILQEARSEVR